MNQTRLIFCLILVAGVSACGGGGGKAPKPPYPGIKLGRPYEIYGRWYEPKYNSHYDEIGVASWYGPGFHGGRTANGESFDQNAMTAAHKTLPLPSIVRVTNLDNGKSALIKINDRGPFAHDRIIDLSRASAAKLDVIRTGTAKVRVQFLEQETKDYVRNIGGGTQYAMQQMNAVNPAEAGEREEEGAKPTYQVAQRIFPDDRAPGIQQVPPLAVSPEYPSEFSVVDDGNQASPPPMMQPHFESPPASPIESRPQTQALMSPPNSNFFVQAGTFGMRENAFKLINRINDADSPQVMEVMMKGKKFYRVMLGPFQQNEDAKNMLSKLMALGIADARIVHN